jgi:TPR repeat protein
MLAVTLTEQEIMNSIVKNSWARRRYATRGMFMTAALVLCVAGGAQAKEDVGKAQQTARQSCETGEAAACMQLGQNLERSDGTAPDLAGAREAYKKACGGGDEDGCFNFAVFLRDGKGGKENKPDARTLFFNGCNKDDLRACHALGVMLMFGENLPQRDRDAGRAMLEKACKAGNGESCDTLTKVKP